MWESDRQQFDPASQQGKCSRLVSSRLICVVGAQEINQENGETKTAITEISSMD